MFPAVSGAILVFDRQDVDPTERYWFGLLFSHKIIMLFALPFICLLYQVVATNVSCVVTNPTTCYRSTANLNCSYDLTQRLDNGQPKYISLEPVWQMNETNIDPSDPQFVIHPATQYSAQLEITNVTELMKVSCFLVLNDGFGGSNGSDSSGSVNVNQVGKFLCNDDILLEMQYCIGICILFTALGHIDKPEVQVMGTDVNSVSMALKHHPRCFVNHTNWALIHLNSVKHGIYNIDDSKLIIVSNLHRGTLYEVEVSVVAINREFQNVTSDPTAFFVRTELLRGYEVAGVVIGCIVLIVLLLLLVLSIICLRKKFCSSSKLFMDY
jgi:hypothetical protein